MTLLYFSVCLYACGIKIKQTDSELSFGGKNYSLPEGCKVGTDTNGANQSGSFFCNGQKFNYAFGIPEDIGPLTLREEFIFAFRGNYHVKFFEKIHIDPKVYRLFIDSVNILEVEEINNNSEMMLMNCSVCNMVAKLIFRGKTYYYPYYSNPTSEQDSFYLIETDNFKGYGRKLWLSLSDSLSSGVLLTPMDKRKSYESLLINTNKAKGTQEVKKLLYGIISKQ